MAKRKDIMLAHKAEKVGIEHLGDSYFVQPKLNGTRCWVEWKMGKVGPMAILRSSSGREITGVPHINAILESKTEEYSLPLHNYDGELYAHGEYFEIINSITSRTKNLHPDFRFIQYYIFDIKENIPQNGRIFTLLNLTSKFINTALKIVKTYFITKENADWNSLLTQFKEDGFEGIIFRHATGKYEEKRSKNLLKLKPSIEKEYVITGCEVGKGWCHDRLGAFLVEGYGVTFAVGTGLTADARKIYWRNRKHLIGKTLLIKHEEITSNKGIPKCAVVVGLKEEGE